MKIAILTKEAFRSPRILAESLQSQLEEHTITADIFYGINVLTRLVKYKESKLSFHFWFKNKYLHYIKDRKLLKNLFKYDVIIISECTPNGFLRELYNVERLKQIIKKPVLYFEVYYLGFVPQVIEILKSNKEALCDRYDIHLSVSEINDMKLLPSDRWFPIGLLGKGFNLYPKRKNEILAILDFPQVNYLRERQMQIDALEKAGIKYIVLDREYSFEDIRQLYMKGALFLLQTPEAFGISILECLCCGTQIFSRYGWAASWRITINESWGEGTLAACFTEYLNEEDLVNKLIQFKNTYHLIETPKKVFATFLANYPQYYYGNQEQIMRLLNKLNEIVKRS